MSKKPIVVTDHDLAALDYPGLPDGGVCYGFEPFPQGCTLTFGDGDSRITYRARTAIAGQVEAPSGATLVRDDGVMVLKWMLPSGRWEMSWAGEALVFATVGMNGFKAVKAAA